MAKQNFVSNLLPYHFIRYDNNNFTKDLDDKKSIIKYCFFLNKVVIL